MLTTWRKSILRGLLPVLVIAGAIAQSSQATMVTGIGAVGMDTTFQPGGLFSTMSIDDVTTIFAEYNDAPQGQFPNGRFILNGLTLVTDLSSGGAAQGVFAGGSVEMRDTGNNTLFTADIDSIVLVEVLGDLIGAGTYSNGVTTVPGAGPLPASGDIVDIVFDISIDIANFNKPFCALSSMNLLPEPASLALLAASTPLVIRRRR